MHASRIMPLCLLASCAAPKQGMPDVADIQDAAYEADSAQSPELPGDSGGERPTTRPQGYAAIRFFADDRANKTYQNGQIKWTGSFSWNAATNIIVYATSWLPTDGPYPPLYDDGPWSQGGHEPEGATANDHVFECEVWFKAEEETTFEYGALNEFDRWIWIGPNGQFTVPKGFSDVIEVKGLVLPPFGEVDVKITLDMAALHPDFASITPYDSKTGLGYRVYLKSSANSWTPVELLDDGQRGDDFPNDNIFTYVQSFNLGPHDGLLADGQHVQFVFVFAMEGVEPDDGVEYKVENRCAVEGIRAYTDYESKGVFHEAPIVFERDSRGKVFNTTVIIGGGNPWCVVNEDCYGGALCKDGECEGSTSIEKPTITSIQPDFGSTLGGTEVKIIGKGFAQGAIVLFGDVQAEIDSVSPNEVLVRTPKHSAGLVDVVVRNPDGEEVKSPSKFEYVPIGTPTLDGRVSFDWDSTFLVATNQVPTDWGSNELKALYVAWDSQYLYIGIQGICEENNAIVGYVDIDFGNATGLSDMSEILDNSGALDAAISSKVIVTEPGFGADLAFGSVGMNKASGFVGVGFTPPECDLAGWRLLKDNADLWWVLDGGELLTDKDEGSVETWIPLTILYPGGVPEGGATLAVTVRLVNHDGEYTSNQALPEASQGWVQTSTAKVRIR